MHDCLEGIVPMVLKMVFVSLANNVSISFINAKIKEFWFGLSDIKNKPRCLAHNVVKADGSVALSASEQWCLFRNLPFILGHLFDGTNFIWKLYLLCSHILEIVFAPKIKRSWLNDMQNCIGQFYEGVLKVNPRWVKPKLHFLLHHPRLIEHYGPLRLLWCMRFEAFYTKIKSAAKSSNNFKNICFTVAHWIQLLKCWQQNSPFCLEENHISSKLREVNVQHLPLVVRSYISQHFGASDCDFVSLVK